MVVNEFSTFFRLSLKMLKASKVDMYGEGAWGQEEKSYLQTVRQDPEIYAMDIA